MPQSDGGNEKKTGWDANPPKDWGEEQTRRIALEIRRLRGRRSAQWLANRTSELGYAISRSVISDLEIARRRYITTAEVTILARALDTAPIALIYPFPYYGDEIEVLPSSEFEKIVAVQWFTGKQGIYLEDLMSMVDQANYHSNLLGLNRARQAWDLNDRKEQLILEIRWMRQRRRDGEDVGSTARLDDLEADIAYQEARIDELKKLGNRDLDAEIQDQIFGSNGG